MVGIGKLAVSRVLYFRWCDGPCDPPTCGSDNHLSRPYVAARLKRPTRTRPGQGLRPRKPPRSSSVLLQMGFTRGKVASAPRGLLHHGSTLACAAQGGHRRSVSVALSFGSRRLDVIQHPALWSPDFPLAALSRQRLSVKLSDSLHQYTANRLPAQRQSLAEKPIHLSLNGSVFTSEANTSVAYPFSASRCRSHSAVFGFMIFSALCPGSISMSPIASASCAVW